MSINDVEYEAGDVAVLTFKAKASGNVKFVLNEDTTSEEFGYLGIVEEKLLTIKASCAHENKTTNYGEIDNEAKHTVTVTCDDCGETIGDVTEEACDTVGAKCVEWSCDKCKAEYKANAEHNYDNPEHKCACGDVEKFKLTIYDWRSEDVLIDTLVIPFGGNLFEYLDDVVVENIAVHDGIYKFNGDWYWYISDEGERIDELLDENSTMPGDDITVYADFSFTGWSLYEDGWKYDVDDLPLMTGWTEIDGEWYYLDTKTGARAEGKTRVPYPTVMIDGNTYAPNQEDIEYSASKGEVFIDKDEAWFLFDEEGKFQSSVTGIIDNRYVLNGQIVWHPGVVEYNGEYYYFRGDKENGNKLAEGDTWVTRNNTDADFVLGGCYNFVNGKLSGINGVVEGKYYENSKLMTSKGLVKLEGGYIYVRSNGEVVVNRDYWITKTNGYSIVNGVYTFDKDGYIVDPIDPTVYDGIVEINGVNYYYENGIKQCCKGVVEMTDENGDIFYIYVKSDGSLATGSYWPTNTNNYLKRGAYDWGTDGRYYPAD
jgi:glucan-binding YG repeat protein